ncbi:hypothetical protein SERLADRAFT_440721 [Serpula lacrymans var. lacrymans S7.9]|uniref:Protein kinase domain-containing protein n=1 Tax=Serpula lacrymans var. lacrymans (strain S7.9) TaxID=578457 RepID=F8P4C1_SERL9|nr:uncharacterized protein SERLADRAFT_440721 [Serpula lacrymans var. lacrymans S7.9]EGO21459.1 hypothetical protein SERLADRAFT_440721 [Serpula lacrymans var. lacrymans S7.9]
MNWIKGALVEAAPSDKVYLGMDSANGLLMAVKQVNLPDVSAANKERRRNVLNVLERELDILRGLQHPHIVGCLYSSVDNDHFNIFMDYVPGGSVAALLRKYGAFEEPLVGNFVRQVLRGFSYLHEKNIIHSDIQGANILIDSAGMIKISGFGLSRKIDQCESTRNVFAASPSDKCPLDLITDNSKHTPSFWGSVFWMAPEVVNQTAYMCKADIWSVGCLAIELLTAEHPWAPLTEMQAAFEIGRISKPSIPSNISADAQDFLRRTFEVNHEARLGEEELLQHPWFSLEVAQSTA